MNRDKLIKLADKLTPAQERCLLKADADHTCSYDLRVSTATCDALASRGLFTRSAGVGAFYSPQTAIKYRLTETGLAVRQILIERAKS